LFLGSILMLVHIDQPDIAELAHNAWLRTIEDGVHTYDMYKEGISTQKVGTKEFAEAVVARIGQKPEKLKAVTYTANVAETDAKPICTMPDRQTKDLVGVDVFLDWWKGAYYGVANDLGAAVQELSGNNMILQAIANRGVKVYPGGFSDTFTVDHWRCRFVAEKGEGDPVTQRQILALLERFVVHGYDIIKTENLYNFDGVKGYSN
jgi:isocitrate dehydrogenase